MYPNNKSHDVHSLYQSSFWSVGLQRHEWWSNIILQFNSLAIWLIDNKFLGKQREYKTLKIQRFGDSCTPPCPFIGDRLPYARQTCLEELALKIWKIEDTPQKYLDTSKSITQALLGTVEEKKGSPTQEQTNFT